MKKTTPTTGLEGEMRRAPTCAGPVSAAQPCEGPLPATFHVLNPAGETVATFASDEKGAFRVALPPGQYTLVPDAAAPLPRASQQQKTVVVNAAEGFTKLVLVFDTGLH